MNKVEPKITQRMLTKELWEMENDGLIIRKMYPQVPPNVEYSFRKKQSLSCRSPTLFVTGDLST